MGEQLGEQISVTPDKGASMEYSNGFVKQLASRPGKPWMGYVKDSARKQKSKTLRTYVNRAGKTVPVKTKADATRALEQWRDELEQAAISNAEDIPQASTPVADYVDSYIDDLQLTQSVEPSTIDGYRKSAKYIRERFAETPVSDLTAAMVQKWEGGLTKRGLSSSTVGKAHRLLKMICKHAVEVHDLTWNPCEAVKPPRRKTPDPNSLSVEDGARLAATLAAMEPTPVVTGAILSLFSGMREGEVAGLRWREVDFDNQVIHVRESIGTASGGAFSKPPKTKGSRRDVPITQQMSTVLETRRAKMRADCEEAGIDTSSEGFGPYFGSLYVLGAVDGHWHSPSVLSREWAALASAMGLVGSQGRRVCYHDLRHSFATRAIAAGADVKSVSSILGHSNAAMTLNIYASADPDATARASRLVSRELSPDGETVPYSLVKRATP